MSAPEDTAHLPESPWGEVRAVCRRICLLRAQGRAAEAARIGEAELGAAAARAGAAAGGGADPLERCRRLLAEEAERVDLAVALAELLAPMLALRLRGAEPARAAAAAPAPRRTRAEAPGVADLIEEMLARERASAA